MVRPLSQSLVAYVVCFALLWLAFVLRVLGQAVQLWAPLTFLPAHESWQGSALPYGYLLAMQLFILLLGAYWWWGLLHGRQLSRPRLGRRLCLIGASYLGLMCIRLLLGSCGWVEGDWFAKPLPVIFHWVLAAKLLLMGHFYKREV